MGFMGASNLSKTSFISVTLEVFSKSDLQPLVAAFGSKVRVHYLGKEFRLFKAYLDIVEQAKSPKTSILRYCRLIQRLPPQERAIWDAAKSRSFDIGIEAPNAGAYYWSAVSSEAIHAAAEVDAQIAISVYGPMKTVGRAKALRAIASAKKAKDKRA